MPSYTGQANLKKDVAEISKGLSHVRCFGHIQNKPENSGLLI